MNANDLVFKQPQLQGNGDDPALSYRSFADFADIAAHDRECEQLVLSYQKVFGESGVWAEEYSRQDVLEKLKVQLAGSASLRICTGTRSGLAPDAHPGFCWMQALDVAEITASIATIKYYETLGSPDVSAQLRSIIADRKVIYVHELGILNPYRGKVRLTQMLYPTLRAVAESSGLRQVLFWSVPNTFVSSLAKRGRFIKALETNGMEFHLGEFCITDQEDNAGIRWLVPERPV
ncbi:MAG: hypothetical protein JNN20_00370 [Betaproteobacteria bacterium]|nr:hypothetical protein [Betaproteobacteria bacterium]